MVRADCSVLSIFGRNGALAGEKVSHFTAESKKRRRENGSNARKMLF
jgi:hypothetical protein